MRKDIRLPVAGQLMHAPVHSVSADDDLLRAARQLANKGWSGAPVVDEDGMLVGVLSEKDILVALSEAAFYEQPSPALVRDVMSTPPRAVSAATDIFALVTLLSDPSRKRVPVVEGGRPVGIITRRDLMRALLAYTEEHDAPDRQSTLDAIAEMEGTHNPFA